MTLLEKIREKLSGGKLPRDDSQRRWAGPGTGSICDACDFPITDIEYEFDAAEGRVVRFHHACIIAWDAERTRTRQSLPPYGV